VQGALFAVRREAYPHCELGRFKSLQEFLLEAHDVMSQKTTSFVVIAVKTLTDVSGIRSYVVFLCEEANLDTFDEVTA
jgi:hypothetical protein